MRLFALLALAVTAFSQPLVFPIPTVRTPIDIGQQTIIIAAGGTVTGDQQAVRLHLTADLSGFQDHITDLLRAQLNRSDRCGERLSVDRAELHPASPSAALAAQVHYEKWACVKALGRQISKRLVGGNATVPVKLTPLVNENREVKLAAEVGEIQADGSLGEVLRSGSFGAQVQEKIRASILSVLDRSSTLHTALPESVAAVARIEQAAFADSGGGRLRFDLSAEAAIPFSRIRDMIERK